MDSNDSYEAGSDEPCGEELSESQMMYSFFNRADDSSTKKLELPPSLISLFKYRAPSEICKTCRDVVQMISNVHATGQTFYAKYHETYAAVKSSSENGCGVCSIFFHVFRLQQQENDWLEEEMKTARVNAVGSSFTWDVRIPWMKGDPTPVVTHLEYGDSADRHCFRASIESLLAGSQSMMLYPLW
jgi:hypothetical protein